MSKTFISPSIKIIPQMDLDVKETEQGGWEGSQTFLARKSALGTSDLNAFFRGATWESLYPEVPSIYRNLTLKTANPGDHNAPGWIAIKAEFTGYRYSAGGSSGDEGVEPTSDLQGNLEESPISRHPKFIALDDAARARLGWLMTLPGTVDFDLKTSAYGKFEDGTFTAFPTGVGSPPVWITPTGDELIFAKMIAGNDGTYKAPAWDYNYRTESKTGFTSAQLAKLGKIVASPPGNPEKPGSAWTWLLVGPAQSQSGKDRFIKDLRFMLIENNPKNQMLYGE